MIACLVLSVAAPDVAHATIQVTGGTNPVYWVQETDTSSNPPQIYYVPQNHLQDVTWSFEDTDCPSHPAGPPFHVDDYLLFRDYWQPTFQRYDQDFDPDRYSGQTTLVFSAYFTDLPSIDLPPGDTLIGVSEWRLHIDCLGNQDQEVSFQTQIFRRVPIHGGGSGGGSGGGTSDPPPVGTPVQPSTSPPGSPGGQNTGAKAKKCKVPKLRGLTRRAATSKLKKAGCKYRFLGKGRVRSTDPKAGKLTSKRVTVRLGR